MSEISYKSKSIIMGCVCVGLVIAIGITVVFLINSLDADRALENKKEKENKVYATVKEVGSDYVKIASLDDGEEIHVNTNEKLKEGDFIVITYNEDEELSITPNDIEVIASNNEVKITTTKKTTTKSVYMSTTDAKTTTASTTKKTTTKKTTTTNKNVSDDDIVEFAKLAYNDTDAADKKGGITSGVKKNFVTLIDFIFYKGTIKGKTFSEISDAAKAKVIYYTLLVNSKIDDKWPDYKETIKSKTADLKAKLIAKYMDITTSICDVNAHGCEMVKSDFAFLKKTLSITWDVVKSAFSYGYNKTYTYLKNWYEVWREK